MALINNVPATNGIIRTAPMILKDVADIVLFHLMINTDSSDCAHFINLHGYKRWHRFNAYIFTELLSDIKSRTIDQFNTQIKVDNKYPGYSFSDLLDHLKTWDKVVLEDIDKLEILRIEYMHKKHVGIELIHCALNILECIHEKTIRQMDSLKKASTETNYFNKSEEISDELHKKYKRKEEDRKSYIAKYFKERKHK